MLVLGVFVALAGASKGPILALVIVLLYYLLHSLKNKISLTEKYIAIKKTEYEKLQESLELDKQRDVIS